MASLDVQTLFTNIHLVRSTGTLAVSEVKTRRQFPVALRVQAESQIFGVVITVVKQHIEDSPLKRFLHLALISRDHACGPQKSRVVHRRGDSEVGVQEPSQGMDRDALALRQIEAFNAQCGLLGTQIKHMCGGHVQTASSGELRIKRLNGTNFFVFAQGLKLHQPTNQPEPVGMGVVLMRPACES